MNRLESIKKSALFTIKFFGLLNYPLTTREVHKYLFNQESLLKETDWALKELIQQNQLDKEGDYWVLPNQQKLAKQRKLKQKISNRLRKRLKFVGWIFKITPYIRTVAICNNLAFNNAGPDSDIDLFIITRSEGVWISRFISTVLIQLLGLRVKNLDYDPGKICLSFYLADNALRLKRIAQDPDPYLLFWIATLDPIYNQGIFSRFLLANQWALKHFPNLRMAFNTNQRKPLSLLAFLQEKIINALPFNLNQKLYTWQKQWLQRNIKPGIPPGGVIISQKIFKSHFNDRRKWFSQKLAKDFNLLA